jgi:hypothetical protein
MSDLLPPFLLQLVGQSPVLLVYLVGIILCLAFRSRCPGPCALAGIGLTLLLVTSVAQTWLFMYFFHAMHEHGWTQERYSMMNSITILGSNVIRAVGMALLVAAVLVGRGPGRRFARAEPLPPGPPDRPEPSRPGGHEITDRPDRFPG